VAPAYDPTHASTGLNFAPTPFQQNPGVVQKASDMAYHWFYLVNSNQQQQATPTW